MRPFWFEGVKFYYVWGVSSRFPSSRFLIFLDKCSSISLCFFGQISCEELTVNLFVCLLIKAEITLFYFKTNLYRKKKAFFLRGGFFIVFFYDQIPLAFGLLLELEIICLISRRQVDQNLVEQKIWRIEKKKNIFEGSNLPRTYPCT